MNSILDKDIKYLPGVGPKRAELLYEECDISTYNDLLYYFPYKYIDRSKFYKISEITPNHQNIQIKGHIKEFDLAGKTNKKRLVAYFTDGEQAIELIWFKKISWIRQSLKVNKEYVVFGKPSFYKGKINIVHPEVEDIETYEKRIQTGLQPFYNTTEKLKKHYINSKFISKLQNNLLLEIHEQIEETLPQHLIDELKLEPLKNSMLNIHFPKNYDTLRKAQFRLKFEELFYIQLQILSI